MKPRMLLIAVLTAAALLCAGCGNASNTRSRTITDMKGRNVVLNEDVTRVVALTAADCEIIYSIGAGDAVVGRSEYCDYPEDVLSLPAVQSGAGTNIEQIVALTPQVVFMDTMDQSVEQIQQLEAAGIQVVVSDAVDLEGVYESISVIGRVMGRERQASEVIDGMKQSFQDLSDKAAACSDGGDRGRFSVSQRTQKETENRPLSPRQSPTRSWTEHSSRLSHESCPRIPRLKSRVLRDEE